MNIRLKTKLPLLKLKQLTAKQTKYCRPTVQLNDTVGPFNFKTDARSHISHNL